MKFTNKLASKNILIIGGTSGIGFAVAEASLEQDANVTIASSSPSKLQSAISRLQSAYPESSNKIKGTTLNLSSEDVEDQIIAAYEFATENGQNKLDHVVNTAGDSFSLPKLSEVTPAGAVAVTTVRYVGNLLLAKHVTKYINISPESSFTTTSGANAAKPGDGWSSIIGVATAVEGLTRALAKDLKPVRANCVSPGAIKTELFDRFGDEATVQKMVEAYAEKTLTGRIGTPEDVAESYLYVMRSAFVTGTTLQIDGGYVLV
ncbi:hypothetical protein TWF569_000056 [Orbilia oligospora]|uniref:Uncharacterized protein n=1 Tax=Orbilia oligospora TaxID=2813651 RepID=A0A7C8KCR0_ORBOL|nr:hypothetical protein TWF102_005040 [Orbilia oligospora]KAF3083578.1 hypothetical protein TWF103_002897 [Orbilia oligospora]KAF3157477.1 hypothetical protein TWF569_000056 [Orbilia oligospora]KAF3158407.1 hypothetical protein TWF751_001647 [Orbilia oligospora]KAF3161101.1 hypothetical protein TWF225_003119 [Orbilia oligospora]